MLWNDFLNSKVAKKSVSAVVFARYGAIWLLSDYNLAVIHSMWKLFSLVFLFDSVQKFS